MSILTFIRFITTPAIAGKKTKDCFTDELRYECDPNLDNWLPEDQPSQTESKFSVWQLTQDGTLKHVVESFLDQTRDIKTLSWPLRKCGAVTTLPTIEFLTGRQESGKDVGLLMNVYTNNLFFVEDKDDGVSVVCAGRYVGLWRIDVHRPSDDFVWEDEDRFFFRNPDTVSL